MKTFPFAALVGQDNLKTALLVCAVNPGVGGLLIRGDKGTAKSTAARGLGEIMSSISRVPGCRFNCPPEQPVDVCDVCNDASEHILMPPPFVNLPLGATEDRVIGSIDFERALKEGKKAFQPGLLAAAHRGILYIDEVNLLADHLVDVLLDVAAMGVNSVQREGLSISHPARFALIGTMNLEEGDLRPQLLDRFGMMIEVEAPSESEVRAEVVRRRMNFEADPQGFERQWQGQQEQLRRQVSIAIQLLPSVQLADRLVTIVSELCCELGARSLRADLIVCKVARTLAALQGREEVDLADIRTACQLALPHRLKRRGSDQSKLEQDKLDQSIKEALAKQVEEGEQQQEDPSDENSENPFQEPPEEKIFSVKNSGNPVRIEINTDGETGRDGRRSTTRGLREGRFLRATLNQNPNKLAVNATVHHSLLRNAGSLDVSAADFHEKVEVVKNANLVLFVVDASGSMAALKRMELVKGTVINLLDDAYTRRDKVAVIAFRGEGATLLLPPTRSIETAQTRLKELPTGGRTPLAQALTLAYELLIDSQCDRAFAPLIILLTDGKANVPVSEGSDAWEDTLIAAEELLELRVPSLVIDTESGYLRFSKAQELAKVLKAEHLSLESVSVDSLSLKIRSKLKSGKKTAR
ncbi:MAG: magnesium chelatase [Candidatus Melainabacteria bacterium]|nr:MAG: magnesium chelatase [Candidatus Melainabacteria bacterium]